MLKCPEVEVDWLEVEVDWRRCDGEGEVTVTAKIADTSRIDCLFARLSLVDECTAIVLRFLQVSCFLKNSTAYFQLPAYLFAARLDIARFRRRRSRDRARADI